MFDVLSVFGNHKYLLAFGFGNAGCSYVWDGGTDSRDNWHQRIVTKLNVRNTAAAHVGSYSRWVVPVIGGD